MNLAISAGAIVVYLVGLETFLRVRGAEPAPTTAHAVTTNAYGGIFRPSGDPILREELIPGANGVVNADGYIGTAYPPGRAHDAFRIVGLGDSITMYHSAERENYLLLTEQALNDAPGLPRVEVLNFGMASYETSQEVHLFEVRGLAYEPDLVVLGYCLNDGMDFVLTVNEMTGRVVFDPGAYEPLDVVSFFTGAVSSATTDVTPETIFARVVASDIWQTSMEALATLAALAALHGFEVVVLVFPVLVDFDRYPFESMHRALAERARSLGFGVVDLLPTYRSRATAAELADDVIHPNALGHSIAAETLTAHLLGRGVELRSAGPP